MPINELRLGPKTAKPEDIINALQRIEDKLNELIRFLNELESRVASTE